MDIYCARCAVHPRSGMKFPVEMLKFLPLLDSDEYGNATVYKTQFVGCPQCGSVWRRDEAPMGYPHGKYPRRACSKCSNYQQLHLLDLNEGQKVLLREYRKSLS